MRYRYVKLTPDQFRAGLLEAGIPLERFCKLTGTDRRRAQRYITGVEDIPPWVGSYLAMLTRPDARAIAHAYADAYATLADNVDTPEG